MYFLWPKTGFECREVKLVSEGENWFHIKVLCVTAGGDIQAEGGGEQHE